MNVRLITASSTLEISQTTFEIININMKKYYIKTYRIFSASVETFTTSFDVQLKAIKTNFPHGGRHNSCQNSL